MHIESRLEPWRLPWQTLHHAWAPKLGRTIVLNSTGQLRLGAMLEANPGVTRYCGRPAWPGDVPPGRLPDFWALRARVPVWLSWVTRRLPTSRHPRPGARADGESGTPLPFLGVG